MPVTDTYSFEDDRGLPRSRWDIGSAYVPATHLGQFGCDEPGHPNNYSHDCAAWDADPEIVELRQHPDHFERAIPAPKETR